MSDILKVEGVNCRMSRGWRASGFGRGVEKGRQVSDISRVESELTMAVAARFVQSTDLMPEPCQFKPFMLP